MSRLCQASWLVCWLLVGSWAAGRAETLQAYRQLDLLPVEPNDFSIEWKAAWDETVAANRQRWQQEIAADTRNESVRKWRLKFRMARLLEELVERHPQNAERRIEACKQIADTFGSVHDGPVQFRLYGRGNYFRKKLVDEFPGRTDLAVDALAGILRCARYAEQSRAWSEYASRRLIALGRAGAIDAEHPALRAGWLAQASLRRAQRRLVAARRALDEAERIGGPSFASKWERGELFLAAGRRREALAICRQVQPTAPAGETWRIAPRIEELSVPQDLAAADYPRDLPLEAQWEALRARRPGPTAAATAALIRAAAAGTGRVELAPDRTTSVWASVDEAMRSQPAQFLAALRQVQSAGAAAALAAAQRRGTDEAMWELYRRRAWSPAVQEAMLSLAERLLRAGRSGLALRTFEDVRAHAGDDALRARAQVGAWLAALGEAGSEADLVELLKGPDSPGPLPWMGQSRPAELVRKRLLESYRLARAPAGNAPPPNAAPLPLRASPVAADDRLRVDAGQLQLADRMASGTCRLQRGAGKVLLSGPNLLVCFGDDPNRPLWARTGRQPKPIRSENDDCTCAVVPPIGAAAAEGRVFCRWGLDASGKSVAGLAAFDAETGRMLWAAPPPLRAASDPAVADGRVYALTIDTELQPFSDLYLVCLDAATGRLLWKRHLVSREIRLWGLERPERQDRAGAGAFYAAVTVSRGAVYCQTHLGFVARCDARDGLLEWQWEYPRVHLARELDVVVRRRGPAPIACGPSVVFLPQDYAGAFALDRRTGRLLWDEPFAPSEDAVGLVGTTLVLRDADGLAAVDAADGTVRWVRHFEEPLARQPAAAPGRVHLATETKLYRLDLATGGTIARTDLPAGVSVTNLLVRGGSLLAVRSGPPGAAAGEPLNASAPTGAAGLRFPLRRTWHLPRRNARLIVPPAEANVPDLAYVMAGGVLECIRLTPRGGVAWSRPLPAGQVGLAWADRTLLGICRRRIVALDARTGRLRWDRRLPFDAERCLVRPPRLIFLSPAGWWSPKALGVIELASGRLLWHRALSYTFDGAGIQRAGWDGKQIHLFGRQRRGEEQWRLWMAMDPADGRIVRHRRVAETEATARREIVLGGGFGFYALGDGRVFEFAMGSETGTLHHRVEPDLLRRDARLELHGPWLQIVHGDRRGGASIVLKRGDPAYHWSGPGSDLRGEWLYRAESGRVVGVHLPSRREVTCALPAGPRLGDDDDRPERVLRYHDDGKRLTVLSVRRARRQWAEHRLLRADVFDRDSGAHLGGQALDGVGYAYWQYGPNYRCENELAVGAGAVVVSDPDGLSGFAFAGTGVPTRPPAVVHRTDRPVAVDGSLADWASQPAFALAGRGGRTGELRMAHDAQNLYLAVRVPDERVLPRVGRGRSGGGDWLELALTVGRYTHRLGLGVDARGRSAWEAIKPDKLPEGARASVRHDPVSRSVVYEAALPRREVFHSDHTPPEFGLSLAVWAESAAGHGPLQAFSWGGALLGDRLQAPEHEPVRLHPLSPTGWQAASAIIHALPDLGESYELLTADCRLRAAGGVPAEAYWRFVQRHPLSAASAQVLEMLRKDLPPPAKASPSARAFELLRLTRAMEAIERHQARSGAYVSQWVYLDPADPPARLEIALHDGRDWRHRATWRKAPRDTDAGALPAPGAWRELRVPLWRTALHDRPIVGIRFTCEGGRVYWDRTSVVAGGRAAIVLDDEPGGEDRGQWRWVEKPVRSGTKAHVGGGRRGSESHAAEPLDTPIVRHLPFDRDRAVALLKKHLPELGATEQAMLLFRKLLLLGGGQASRRAELYGWFLRSIPDHPRAAELLGEMLEAYGAAGRKDAVAAVEAYLAASPLPAEAVYAYNRQYAYRTRAPIRGWQILGPLPNPGGEGYETAFAPEQDGVQLGRTYAGAGEQAIRWQLRETRSSTISLASLTPDRREPATAYAACWLNAERPTPAMLEVTARQPCKVWINRKLVHARPRDNSRTARVAVHVAAGVSELLVKLCKAERRSSWGFGVELLEAHGRGPAPGVTVSSARPKASP